MCSPMIAAGVVGAAGLFQTYGAYQQANFEKDVANNNAKIAEYQAQDAQRRGEEEAMKVRRQAQGLKSQQRAMIGGRGVDVSYGTAFDLQEQTDFFGDADAATVRLNAAKDAWTLRRQRDAFLAQKRAIKPGQVVIGGLLSTAASALGAYGMAGGVTGGAAAKPDAFGNMSNKSTLSLIGGF